MTCLDHLRLDERLVTLDVQHDLAGEIRGHFRDAIGARPMRRRVIIAMPPKPCTAAAIRSSSVATTTASTPRAEAARR